MAKLFPARAIDRLVNVAASGADDAELLRRYRDTGDPEAFDRIVRRHARTVLGVCRRVLIDPHAADDAFQATFLQLVRKASTLHSPGALAAWLHSTARRTALRHRRPDPPPQLAEPPASAQCPLDSLTARELLAAIEDEIARLPERYRLPLILCYLDGQSKRVAADRLGLPAGVFCGRLDRGREKLRAALVRRGFAPTAALGLLAPLAESASADLIRHTVGVCVRGEPAPVAVALLAAGRTGVLTKAGLAAGLLMLGGLGLIAAAGRAEPPAPQAKVETPQPADSPARRDLHGDPLPPDAVARMGSIRWRHADDFRTTIDVVPSPTGQLVATMSRGGKGSGRPSAADGKGVVRVWDLSDGRPVCQFPWDDTVPPWNLQFTPDGSRLMILLPSGAVKFHDPLTGKLLAESKPVLVEEKAYYRSSEPTNDRRWVVTEGSNDALTLTEIVADPAATPRQVRLDLPTTGEPDFDFFSCDGTTLVGGMCTKASGWKPLFLRWDVRTGKLIRKTWLKTPARPGNQSNGHVVASSRDGKRVATWRYDVAPNDVLRVWDTETGAEVVELEGATRRGGYGRIRFSPDGNRLVAEDRTETTRTAIVWELDHGQVIARVAVAGWCDQFFLSPDGKTLLAASFQGMMFGTWDLATGRRLSTDTGHESRIRHLAFTPDGKTLLTASTDPEERVIAWDAATGQKLQELAAPHGSSAFWRGPSVPFVLTPGGAVVTTGKGTLVWTDRKTGRELRRVTPGPVTKAMDPGDRFQAERLSLIHDPRTGRPAVLGLHSFGPNPLASEPKYRWKDVVTSWDAESGELLAHRAYSWDRYAYMERVVSPDGRLLARRAYDSPTKTSLAVLDPALGGRGSVVLKHPGDLFLHLGFAPDGQTLMTVTRKHPPEKRGGDPVEAHTIRLWEVRTGLQRLAFPVSFEPSTFAFSPDGRFLAAERTDTRTISVWDLATGTEVATRSGYRSLVQTLAFRPDGQALASGHTDGTALVWNLSELPGVKPAATDREAAWEDLASADAGKAYRAILALVADPGGVAFLRDKMKPAPEIPASRIRKLVKDLDSDVYATREAATTALKELGDAADAELRTLPRGELSEEQRQRIADVLESRGSTTESDPDRLRALRGVEVLERVGSAEALTVLGELAKGAPGARLTREAAGATRRRSTQSQ